MPRLYLDFRFTCTNDNRIICIIVSKDEFDEDWGKTDTDGAGEGGDLRFSVTTEQRGREAEKQRVHPAETLTVNDKN